MSIFIFDDNFNNLSAKDNPAGPAPITAILIAKDSMRIDNDHTTILPFLIKLNKYHEN